MPPTYVRAADLLARDRLDLEHGAVVLRVAPARPAGLAEAAEPGRRVRHRDGHLLDLAPAEADLDPRVALAAQRDQPLLDPAAPLVDDHVRHRAGLALGSVDL